MTPAEFYKTYFPNDRARLTRVLKKAGTNLANFQQIALANGSCGKGLAKRLSQASDGEMGVLEILYPEDYSKQKKRK